MTWLSFAYMVAAVILGFFTGYYFILAYSLRKQVIYLTEKLDATYELIDFAQLLQEESTQSED